MHPDLNDFDPWSDEIQEDVEPIRSLPRPEDIDPAEEELSLWVSL